MKQLLLGVLSNDVKQLYFTSGFTIAAIMSIVFNNCVYGFGVLVIFSIIVEILNRIYDYEKHADLYNSITFFFGGVVGELYILYLSNSVTIW
jgi:isocitrate dehydrogenase kinase/phosphatase